LTITQTKLDDLFENFVVAINEQGSFSNLSKISLELIKFFQL